jgi:hypothetical protein
VKRFRVFHAASRQLRRSRSFEQAFVAGAIIGSVKSTRKTSRVFNPQIH